MAARPGELPAGQRVVSCAMTGTCASGEDRAYESCAAMRGGQQMRVQHRLVRLLAVGALALGFAAQDLVSISRAEAQQASQAGQAAEKVELLFVQNGLWGRFDGKTWTLMGGGPTPSSSARPERGTGRLRTAEFVGHWDKGPANFAKHPPNATLSVFG